MMTEPEAREKTVTIKSCLRTLEHNAAFARRILFEMKQREGWKALGYKDFVAYGKAEFDYGKSHTYRLADAGRVETILQLTEALPDSHLLELARLPDELIPTTWLLANSLAAEQKIKLNPRLLKECVDLALGIKPKRKRVTKPLDPAAPPRHFGQSVQLVLNPGLGTYQAKWMAPAAEGITLILKLNRNTNLDKILSDLAGVKAQVEKAVSEFEGQALAAKSTEKES